MPEKLILTHVNADFDAVAALLGAHKLYPDHTPLLPRRINHNVREFLTLYHRGLPFVDEADAQLDAAREVLLVDTQRLTLPKRLRKQVRVRVIDHHPLREKLYFTPESMQIEEVGATVTLLVEHMQARGGVTLTSLEATLLALGIYADTGALSYGTTTPRDLQAAAWLLARGAVLDTVRRFLEPPLLPEQQAVYDLLLHRAESRTIHGFTVTVAHARLGHNVNQLNTVVHKLRDELNPAALFAAVDMGTDYVQLIARSTVDAVDVGAVARDFGGGGHTRAASAPVKDQTLEQVVARLWQLIPPRVQPITTLADLMSQGVRTVPADQPIQDIIRELRRVGHEGYPVLDADGALVGLLKLRDADRAMEHGLHRAPVRQIMTAGRYTLTPDDSVSALEQLIVNSGWGQIPIVSPQDPGTLIGIVTRTDLIQHWAETHPSVTPRQPRVSPQRLAEVLGTGSAALIEGVARFAQQMDTAADRGGVRLYMVGGVVRDLLLGRRNDDIDFVVESNGGGAHHTDGIAVAEALGAAYGGRVSSYKPFGTAKWRVDDSVAAALGVPLEDLPATVDFATSRNEFYERPTALPTVYAGSIKLDLHRRDFTINTLAVQLSPAAVAGRVLDFYGGLHDLEQGTLRVLHSLSFVDDPTRVIRAMRFKYRLGFRIEARTAELIATAHPMLGRITGERIRNELTLLLREHQPEHALLELQRLGVLAAIHPAFRVDQRIETAFQTARTADTAWLGTRFDDIAELYWSLIFAVAELPPDAIADLCARLLLGNAAAQNIQQAVTLVQDPGVLTDPDARPSQITARLDGLHALTLFTAWVLGDSRLRARLERFKRDWEPLQPQANGHTLRQRGLEPGPHYRVILDRLRAAWLDGEIASADAEAALLDQLIAAHTPTDD